MNSLFHGIRGVGGPQLSVGLEWGEEFLRGVILKRGLKGYTLVHAAEWSLPREGEERDTMLRRALATLKDKAGTKPAPAWFNAFQDASVCLRLIQLPPIPHSELKGAVLWEARTQVPFPLDRAFSDHLLLGEVEREGGGRQLLVMLGAAQEEMVLKRLEPFQAAGIRISGVAPTAAVLWGGRKQLADLPAGEVFAIVHARNRTTTMCVGKGDLLDFTREITLVSEPLASASPWTVSPDHALIRELRRSFDYYQERHHGERITTVVLSGAIGCEPGAAGLLASLLGCGIKIADPLGRLGTARDTPALAGRAPAFAVAAAAALAGRGLNLLPAHLRPRATLPLRRALVPAAALLVLGAGYHHWSLVSAETKYRALAERSEPELSQLKSRDETILKLKGREARLKRLSLQMPRASTEPIPWHDLFQRVAESLPGNVTLKHLGFTSLESTDRISQVPGLKASLDGVVFGGESEALVALATAIESLQATGWFGSVRVSAPIRKSKEYSKPASEFGLTFEVRLGGKPSAVAVAGKDR